MCLLRGFHQRMRAFELVVLALMIERFFAGPFLTLDPQVFIGTRVTSVLANVTAVGAQLLVIAAGNDAYRGAATVDHVQRRELTGSHGRGDEAGAVGDQKLEFAGDSGGMRRAKRAVRG